MVWQPPRTPFDAEKYSQALLISENSQVELSECWSILGQELHLVVEICSGLDFREALYKNCGGIDSEGLQPGFEQISLQGLDQARFG